MSFLSAVVVVGVCSALLIALKRKAVVIIIKTLPRDLKLIWMFIRLNIKFLYLIKTNTTVTKLFRKTVRRYPKKIAFYFEDEKWTFEQVDKLSNQIGRYFKDLGYERGDSISLLIDSRPEFVCILLGLAKIGVITALINTNVMSREALAHAIRSGKGKSLIFGSRFKEVVEKARSAIPELRAFQFNDQLSEVLSEASDLKSQLQNVSDGSMDSDVDDGNCTEIFIYIYTSGTTGLPKASIIKHTRYILGFLTFNLGVEIKTKDVIYTPVPLYHSLGLITGISQALIQGTTVVIKKKFSASNFWKDCEKFQCTMAQYIGEMARYVILAHRHSKEKPTYRMPKMFGNGMKPTTWKQFIETFNVGQIFEFYGSTEGNFGLFNLDNKVGSIGYVPIYGDFVVPMALVKCNASGEPIRNKEGFCQLSDYDTPGLLLCKLSKLIPVTKFDGYSDKESSKKKLLENVLKKGDVYFNSGDVLIRDDHGYYYFLDRTGDTFRWKGENVSTTEVEDILSSLIHKDVAVYGVEIPGSEGKAGMAAIVDPDKSINLKQFLQDCRVNIPSYSIPIFLRIVDRMPQTGTFKIQKFDFQKEGFDITSIKDKLYFLDPNVKEYVELNDNLYDDIRNCEVRI